MIDITIVESHPLYKIDTSPMKSIEYTKYFDWKWMVRGVSWSVIVEFLSYKWIMLWMIYLGEHPVILLALAEGAIFSVYGFLVFINSFHYDYRSDLEQALLYPTPYDNHR